MPAIYGTGAANDNPPSTEASADTLLVETPTEGAPPQAANDNSPIVPLQATGTDATTTAQ
jgi:hypothetical protein